MTTEERKKYNLKMKKYRDDNKFMNTYHCHNYKRRQADFETISIIEYLEYRKFISTNLIGVLRSTRSSNFVEWEKYKKINNLYFTKPKLKGNFTHAIKQKIQKEFS
jgi:hypothetical protein